MPINYPEGAQDYPTSIIQCVTDAYYINSESQIAGNSYYNYNTISITPKSTNSTLVFVSTPKFITRNQDRGGSYASSNNTYIYVQDVTSNSQVKIHEWINYADDQGGGSSVTDGLRLSYPIYCEFNNTATSQRQFRTRAYVNGSTRKGRICGELRMIQQIWEIDN